MKAMRFERLKRPRTQNTSEIYSALSAAQGEFPEIPKTKTGHGYKYADIADILKAVRPILSKHGLCVFQEVDGERLVTLKRVMPYWPVTSLMNTKQATEYLDTFERVHRAQGIDLSTPERDAA